MKTIFLFSGTKEGRMISEALTKALVYHTVFVATEYGRMVMEKSDYAVINEGRLMPEDMRLLFADAEPDIVIDATHPYAIEVTKNIKAACEGLDTEYIRVARSLSDEGNNDEVYVVDSVEEAVKQLKNLTGNILLTTGVKTLKEYTTEPDLKGRIYTRILPSVESLTLALETGIKPGQIIAQEGPFTVESNKALISQYDIKVLVTKNSGETGGFREKLIACEEKNVKAIIIDRTSDEGISPREAIKKITGLDYKEKKATIVGIGPGKIDLLTEAAKCAIEKADLLIGAKRMVDFGKTVNLKARSVCEYEAEKILKLLDDFEADYPVIMMSGDTGFHSGAVKAKNILENAGYEIKVLPGISSVSYFASLIGWEYSDSRLLSLHGEETDVSEVTKECGSFFAILSGPEDIVNISDNLSGEWEVAIGYNLGYETQRIDISYIDNIKTYTEKGLYVYAARRTK